MNQKQEKRRRLNARIDHIEAFAQWLRTEPPMWRIFSWHSWKKRRPVFREVQNEDQGR